MDVEVDGWAWLPKSELTVSQIYNLKQTLRVYPTRAPDVPGEDPKPILLYDDQEDRIGVPREYYFKNRREGVHKTVVRMTKGSTDWTPAGFVGTLRPEQEAATKSVLLTLQAFGNQGGIIQAKPGWGKTVCALAIAARLACPTLIVVHRTFLMDQWKKHIARFVPGAKVGIVQQDVCDFAGKTFVIGMVHSLGKDSKYPDEWYRWPGLVITDECFVGTQRIRTPTGERYISEIREGDAVFNAVGVGRVITTTSRVVPLSSLVVVALADGSKSVCTSTHPYFTQRGWVAAQDLAASDRVLTPTACIGIVRRYGRSSDASEVCSVRNRAVGSTREEVLLAPVCGEGEGGREAVLSDVRGEACSAERESFLFSCLSREMDVREAFDPGVADETIRVHKAVASGESARRSRGGFENDRLQSDEKGVGARQGVQTVETDRTRADSAGRERSADSAATAVVTSCTREGVGSGARGADRREEGERVSTALQSGHSPPPTSDCDRSGRRFAQFDHPAEPRSEEGKGLGWLRVVSVSRAKSEDIEQRGICRTESGVVVHNLSVAGHPSYVLSSGAVVHNCHRISARTWSVVPPLYPAALRLGFTATPRRKDSTAPVFWYQIGPVIYSAKEERLTPQIKRVWTKFNLYKTDKFNPHLAPRHLVMAFLVASPPRNNLIVSQLVKAVSANRKCLVLSERINHLKVLQTMLRKAWGPADGIPPTTGWYVGGRSTGELAEAAKAQVIWATAQYASEGLDIPALDTLFLTTPLSDVEQACGRILRPHPEKKDPIVVDFRDDSVPMMAAQGRKRDNYYRTVT